jgi:WD40 repeat protein
METRAQLGAVPRAVIVFALLALLTLVMATAIAIGASNPPKLPPPFGPAANGLIAIASGDGIRVVEADGSGLRQIIDSAAADVRNPTWSRDGTRLAYWTESDDGTYELFMTDAEGSDPIPVATAPGEITGETWSADGSEFMFSAIDPDRIQDGCFAFEGNACGSRLFVAATDGSGSRQVGGPDLDARGPALSPDGRTIAFGGGEAANQGLYLMNWDGSDVRLIESDIPVGSWAFAQQSWAPDGGTLVTHDGQIQSAWLVHFADGEPSGIEKIRDYVYWPNYAPDGRALAWATNSGGSEIFVPGDGAGPVRLSSIDIFEWAPDGDRLVGMRGNEVVTLDRTGEDVQVLATAGADDGLAWQRVAE